MARKWIVFFCQCQAFLIKRDINSKKFLTGKFLEPLLVINSIIFSNLIYSNAVQAQLSPDTTLGSESSAVIPINGFSIPIELITGGATRGTNLFHSFREFNVEAGRGVYFDNPVGIENILTRVTGNNPSRILGLLGVDGNANLFLMNPKGIIFGSEAFLDLRGSFVATTASEIVFDGGNKFSAIEPQAPSLLAVNIPIGLNFRQPIEKILVQPLNPLNGLFGTGLNFSSGKTLALVGGEIEMNGGIINAPGGQVQLGGLAAEGTIGLNLEQNLVNLSFPYNVPRANVFLTDGSVVNVSGEGGGSVQIQASQLSFLRGSGILANTLGAKNGGDIFIKATDAVTVDDSAIITGVSNVFNNPQLATGRGGNITIQTGQLTVSNNARNSNSLGIISTSSFGVGDAGNINIEVERLRLTDGGQIATDTRGTGKAGELSVYASKSVEAIGFLGTSRSGLFSENRSEIPITNGTGSLMITTGQLIVRDGAAVSTQTRGAGDGGNLNIFAEKLLIQNGGQVQAGTFGTGKGGTLTVNITDSVEINGTNGKGSPSGLFTATTGVADAGDLTINTRTLSVRDGGTVSASTAALFGKGRGGNLTINGSDSVEVIGSFKDEDSTFFSSLVTETGRLLNVNTGIEPALGGNLTINTSRLTISNGARVSTSTFFQSGRAGDLTVTAKEGIEVVGKDADGNLSLLTAETTGTGDAGNLRINTRQLAIRDGAEVSVNTSGLGKGGNISAVSNSVLLTNNANITSRSQGEGKAGDIEVTANNIRLFNNSAINAEAASQDGGNIKLKASDLIFLRRGSQISTTAGTARGSGNGGNINIDTSFLVAIPNENSDITANSFGGKGGAINITAQGIFGLEVRNQLTPFSDITAFSQLSPTLNGEITLNTPDVDPSQGLVELPQTIIDPNALIAQNPCLQRRGSQFIVTGKGGLPPSPNQVLAGETVQVDLIEPVPVTIIEGKPRTNQQENPAHKKPVSDKKEIIPAQGWMLNEHGEVILTASATNGRAIQRQTHSSQTCPMQ